MTLSDFVFAGSVLLVNEDAEKGRLCILQAYLQYASGVSTVLWSGIIAYSLYDIVLKQGLMEIQKKLKLFVAIGYGLPIFLALVPLFMDAYGPQSFLTDKRNSWCGITREKNADSNNLYYDIGLRFFPVVACSLLWNLYFCYKLWMFLKGFQVNTNLMCAIRKKIIFIPIIPIFCWSIEIFFRVQECFKYLKQNGDSSYFDEILQISDMVLIHLHPILNFLIYANTSYFKREWCNYLSNQNKNDQLLKKENYSSCGDHEEVKSIEVEQKNSKSTHEQDSFGTLNR